MYNVFVTDANGFTALPAIADAYTASATVNAYLDAGYMVDSDLWTAYVPDAMVTPAMWAAYVNGVTFLPGMPA